jgi:ribosomal protein S27AE
MRLFRPGIYEYDKTPERKTRACDICGRDIVAGNNRKRCGPCSDLKFKERRAIHDKNYRERKKVKAAP